MEIIAKLIIFSQKIVRICEKVPIFAGEMNK